MLLIALKERRIMKEMKEIKKEILVKKVILTEEEMSEVVGGARVNGFIIPSNFYKAFKLGKFGR